MKGAIQYIVHQLSGSNVKVDAKDVDNEFWTGIIVVKISDFISTEKVYVYNDLGIPNAPQFPKHVHHSQYQKPLQILHNDICITDTK